MILTVHGDEIVDLAGSLDMSTSGRGGDAMESDGWTKLLPGKAERQLKRL